MFGTERTMGLARLSIRQLLGDSVVNKPGGPHPVSANNPCPFLRALVSMGKLSDDREPLSEVATVVTATARGGEGRPELPYKAVFAIASVANGFGPCRSSMPCGTACN